jgi:hypothetical protein
MMSSAKIERIRISILEQMGNTKQIPTWGDSTLGEDASDALFFSSVAVEAIFVLQQRGPQGYVSLA